jgi:hypothetical protein
MEVKVVVLLDIDGGLNRPMVGKRRERKRKKHIN